MTLHSPVTQHNNDVRMALERVRGSIFTVSRLEDYLCYILE